MLFKKEKRKKFTHTHTQSANNVSSMQTLKKTAFLKKNHGDD